MLIEQKDTKLLSLLLVFLTENFEASHTPCNVCDSTSPRFGKSFFISQKWVCVDCILKRIRTEIC